MTPAPDAGREPSAQAVEAARLAVDETAQCDCEMTDGASCFFRLDLPGQKAMCLKSALRAAYAVDFPTDDEIAAIVRGRALPASQPGELTNEECAEIAEKANRIINDPWEDLTYYFRTRLPTKRTIIRAIARALSPAPKDGP